MPANTLLAALTRAGIGPRRRMAAVIMGGVVTVNGEVVSDLRHPVNLERDRVSIEGRSVELRPPPPLYLMLHKPAGVVCTVSDERARRTVLDILPAEYRGMRLYPVGRLDKDSTGLLLLTNDGRLAHRLAHPRFGQEREYLVQIDSRLAVGERRRLERGIELEDGLTSTAVVREVSTRPPYSYSVTIHQGRKRQVRRMFAATGHRVLVLKRIRLGPLALGALGEGQVRELSAAEAGELCRNTGPG